jgi:hypothetical protein
MLAKVIQAFSVSQIKNITYNNSEREIMGLFMPQAHIRHNKTGANS